MIWVSFRAREAGDDDVVTGGDILSGRGANADTNEAEAPCRQSGRMRGVRS